MTGVPMAVGTGMVKALCASQAGRVTKRVWSIQAFSTISNPLLGISCNVNSYNANILRLI